MLIENLKKLKSGTDIRGVAVEAGTPITLTDGAVDIICRAFAAWLSAKYNKKPLKIAIGNDSRISAERIKRAAAKAFIESGCDVLYTGLSSTPSMFILLKQPEYGCDASVMITASHMPFDRNGLKFFTPEGGLDGKDVDEIIAIAEKGGFTDAPIRGKYSEESFMDRYSAILVEKVERACGKLPLKGKKIIVDAGNGAGGFFAEKVLQPLGADTDGSQFLEPDGTFPNHIPNPEDKTAIKSISKATVKSNADLGIIFDTDVDRAACVGPDGEEINRDSLIALISGILLKEKAGTIVTDSVTSDGLAEFIKNNGGRHLRYKRGYKNVIDKCKELNAGGEYSPLAIETSGHAAFAENYYLDDGAYLIVKILISMAQQAKKGKGLLSVISDLKRPVEEAEIRLGFTEKSKDFKAEGARVIEELTKAASLNPALTLAPENYEGVRIGLGYGWLLVRMSVHDPVMPINFASDTAGGNKKTAQLLYSLLSGYEFLNLQNLQNFLSL